MFYNIRSVLILGPEACWILAPRPGIKPTSSTLEGKVLHTGPAGESQGWPRIWNDVKWAKPVLRLLQGKQREWRANSQITVSGIIYTSFQIIIKENWKGDNTMIKGIENGTRKTSLSVLSHSAVAWAWGWRPLHYLLLYMCKAEER